MAEPLEASGGDAVGRHESRGAGVRVAEITFSDGTKLNVRNADVIVIVGPNNSGKTRTLQDLMTHVAPQAGIQQSKPRAVTAIGVERSGTAEDAWKFLQRIGVLDHEGSGTLRLARLGLPQQTQDLRHQELDGWEQQEPRQRWLQGYFVTYLSTSRRQELSDPCEASDFGRLPKSHPLHYLHQDRTLRKRLSAAFKRAFGSEIGIDLQAGRTIPIHVGPSAEPKGSEPEGSEEYRDRLRTYPRISEEGDGVRSFVGILLNCMTTLTTLNIIDEPEAFLHPPQARALGRMLCEERAAGSQIFMATHSADIVRGVLAARGARTMIIRMRREGAKNVVHTLSQDDINEVWADPVLRYSNVLDGIFYERVVICEGNGDCRFYQAIADALREPEEHGYVRDAMFTHAGGKGAIAKLVRSLRKLEVPVVAVADFDVLQDAGTASRILEAVGIAVSNVRGDWQKVTDNIARMGSRSATQVRNTIRGVLDGVPDSSDPFPRDAAHGITNALKPQIGWQKAKQSGLNVLDRGPTREAGESLLRALAAQGFLVVPVGELESFLPTESADKNQWVDLVLSRFRGALGSASELESARAFVAKMIGERPVPGGGA